MNINLRFHLSGEVWKAENLFTNTGEKKIAPLLFIDTFASLRPSHL